MTKTYSLQTQKQNFYPITAQVKEVLHESGVSNGLCVVFCPHTTAGVTINENADPDVVKDMLLGLDKAFPDRPEFKHVEGNSSAHLKSSCVGASLTVIVENSKLKLGTWQNIYFCEFDGPRIRQFFVKVI